jgi:imidazoleglycerol-phosphate dehydratase
VKSVAKTRNATVHRKTKETDICVELNLDGSGQSNVSIGVPFLEHMLDLFAKHGLFDLQINCNGDLQIDDHHSVEDIAITLGQALVQALGDKAGINRYGEALVPMKLLGRTGRTLLAIVCGDREV